ncbi:MAG: NAD(P)-binding protein, partial [Clostridia bacterium]|nr:NAD(P)-binding protein [Clostridia bacterium]
MRYIVVGCGISGATVARLLAESGKKVEIWERRDHI